MAECHSHSVSFHYQRKQIIRQTENCTHKSVIENGCNLYTQEVWVCYYGKRVGQQTKEIFHPLYAPRVSEKCVGTRTGVSQRLLKIQSADAASLVSILIPWATREQNQSQARETFCYTLCGMTSQPLIFSASFFVSANVRARWPDPRWCATCRSFITKCTRELRY